MIKTSEQSNEIITALIKAQSEFGVALKDTTNDFTKKNYADFQSIVEAARPSLTKNNLGFMQMPVDTEKGLSLVTRIFHTSGQWIEGSMPIKTLKEDPQSMGAAITYSKRYALQAALGIIATDEDSDAENSMDRVSGDRLAQKTAVLDLLKKFNAINVKESEVLAYIGINSVNELKESDLSALRVIGSDIKSKKSKKEDYFKGGNR